ncbi:TetR family transcriptional regulator [Pseudonocardia sp. HH130630-07]|nr:TetR family transcriptional regulator [Pseudonocardia sp. HH130630-07]
MTMGQLAQRLGVRTPSLYKHVAGQQELRREIAVLVSNEVADLVGTAIRGRSGRDALAAGMRSYRDYVVAHSGRWATTTAVRLQGPDDPMAAAVTRQLDSFAALLSGYAVPEDQMVHAMRTVRSLFHGFASIQAAHGFQLDVDVDESFEWLIEITDRGLRAMT